MPPITKNISQYKEEELLQMSRRDITEPLNDKEIAFCEYFIKDNNVKLACIKAGYQPKNGVNYRLRHKQAIIDYIAWLKIRTLSGCFVTAEDIVASYAKMAFYDINDYVEIKGNKVRLKDSDQFDGQVIQEISINNSGSITVKFPDRLKAFDKLENYMTENPYDWKRRIEEEKLEILKERMEIDKTKVGMESVIEDDGFIEALEKAADFAFDEEGEHDGKGSSSINK